MKQSIKWNETCKVNVDQIQVFVIINNVGIMINVYVNAMN